jgi:hypothetical protein
MTLNFYPKTVKSNNHNRINPFDNDDSDNNNNNNNNNDDNYADQEYAYNNSLRNNYNATSDCFDYNRFDYIRFGIDVNATSNWLYESNNIFHYVSTVYKKKKLLIYKYPAENFSRSCYVL